MDDKNKGLPPGWLSAPLGEVVDILDSQRIPVNSKERSTRTGNIPYYGATGQVGWIDNHLFDEELVLLGEDGAPFFDSTKPVAYMIHDKSWVNNHAHVLRGKQGISNAFLLHQLNQVDFHGYVSGTTRAKLSQAPMRRISLSIAPEREQTRISDKLDELLSDLDKGVEALERVRRNLERYRASVLKAAVEGRLTEEWRAEHKGCEPASELLARILVERRRRWEETEEAKYAAKGKKPPKNWKSRYKEPAEPDTTGLPDLPEGWVWASVDQLAEVVRGASPRPAGDPRFFGGDIPWITVAPLTAEKSPYLRAVSAFVTQEGAARSRFIEEGTLLLTNSGATLGVPRITMIGGCINDGVAALLHVDGDLKLYLYHFLGGQTAKLRSINQGAAQPNLNTTIIKRIPVPLPPEHEHALLVDTLDRATSLLDALLETVTTQGRHAPRLRQSILKAAFEGRLVPQDPSDEPASALLERIRAAKAAEKPLKKKRKAKKKAKRGRTKK